MSRVSDLENKVDALERNVGMLAKEAGLDDCLMISDCSSIRKYRDGIESGCAPVKEDSIMKDYTKCNIIAKTLQEISEGAEVRVLANPHYQYIRIIRIYRNGNITTQYTTKIPLCEEAEESDE